MPKHRRRRATPSGGGKPLVPFGLRAAQTRLLGCGSSMMLGHHPPRRASYPNPRRLQHGLSDFCHGLLAGVLERSALSSRWYLASRELFEFPTGEAHDLDPDQQNYHGEEREPTNAFKAHEESGDQ